MADGGVDEEVLRCVQDLYTIGKQQTLQEDAEFGVRQLVNVVLKALSPGINSESISRQASSLAAPALLPLLP
jgi:uncharacterized membrane protein